MPTSVPDALEWLAAHMACYMLTEPGTGGGPGTKHLTAGPEALKSFIGLILSLKTLCLAADMETLKIARINQSLPSRGFKHPIKRTFWINNNTYSFISS